MKVENIDRMMLRAITADVNTAVQTIAEKYGISIKPGRGTFGGKFGTVKLELATVAESGTTNTREAEDFKQFAEMFGLKPEWLGKTFRGRGQEFIITGLRVKAHKRPVIAKGVSDGQEYVFPAQSVAKMLA